MSIKHSFGYRFYTSIFHFSGIAFVFSDGPALFGKGTGSVINQKFNCNGNETDLSLCGSTSSWSVSDSASHSTDIAVSCESKLTKMQLMNVRTMKRSAKWQFKTMKYWPLTAILSMDTRNFDVYLGFGS